ncbi:MAG: DPP IV N-terminal domain-containing protein [Syntrophobacterales bacterium]|nr:DPP IV N-terminal domain-containing protein [Syntrophobacterales bacterium]
MMIGRFNLFFGLVLLIGVTTSWFRAYGQDRVYLDITDPSFRKLPIAVPGFRVDGGGASLSEDLLATTKKDLQISGIFQVLDSRAFFADPQKLGVTAAEIDFGQFRQGGAEYLIRGSYSTDGQNIHLELRFFDVVGRRMLLGKAYDGKVSDRKLMIHRFVDEILKLLTGEGGIFSTKIAFVNKEGKVSKIYMVDFDGSNLTLLTPKEELAMSPSWSPDGRFIAYIGYRGNRTALCLLDVASRYVQDFFLGGVLSGVRFNPQRGLVTVSRSQGGSSPEIVTVNLQGAIVDKVVSGGWDIKASPTWSPDGRKVAYVSNESGNPQIYIYDVNTGSKRRITFSGDYNTSPSWSPKGDLIAYSGIVNGHHQIFVVNPETSQPIQLTTGGGNNEAPTWSPDGRMIAFQSNRSGRYAIWVMLKNGSDARLLTEIGGEQILPSWSPKM